VNTANHDFKYFVINTPELWGEYEHDESKNIKINTEGIGLESCESYDHEKDRSKILTTVDLPLDFALDPYDILYILDGAKNKIQRINLSSNVVYWIDHNSSEVPKTIAVGSKYIHLLYNKSFKIINKNDITIQQAIDVGISEHMKLLTLDKYENPLLFDFQEKQIYRISVDTQLKTPVLKQSAQGRIPDPGDKYSKVLRIIAGKKDNKIYLLTNDRVLIFNFNGIFEREIAFRNIQGFIPSDIALDKSGNIYLGNNLRVGLVSPIKVDIHTEKITILNYYGRSDRIFSSGPANGMVYVISLANENNSGSQQNRLEQIRSIKRFVKQGEYISKWMDSQIDELKWHKIIVESDIPEGTSMEIYYSCSSDENDKDWIRIPTLNPHDALILSTSGKYIRFQIQLKSKDGVFTPTVRAMQALYPRRSYLRYLPAIYQEDEKSKEFLERFLSLFESFFMDLEGKIFSVAKYFDINSTPDEFIPWLASWVGIDYDERLTTRFTRKLIQRTPDLYKKRGTRDEIQEIISLYLDVDKSKIIIFEGFQLDSIDDLTTKRDYSKMFFGDSNPIYAFCVLLPSWVADHKKLEVIKQMIEDEKPAHTTGCIRLLVPQFRLNDHTYLGVNSCINSDVGDRDFVVGRSILDDGVK
jgi:phage tail-like protein